MAKKTTTDAPPATDKKPKGIKATTNITHDGKKYVAGDVMPSMTKEQGLALLNLKAIEPYYE